MLTLRPYQAAAVEAGLRCLGGAFGAGLMVEPTGSGKSLVIANIVQQLDAPALVFQPTKEILEQNVSKLLAYNYEPAIYSASLRQKRVGALTLATIGSVKDITHLFHDVRYVLIDEADLVNAKGGMYQRFLHALGNVRVLGLTATPFRLVTDRYGGAILKFLTRTRPRIFQYVAHHTQIGALQRQGFLAPLVYHRVGGFDPKRLLINSTGADYNDFSVQDYFTASKFRERTLKVVERLLARGRAHILVFTRFVADAEDLVERLQRQQVRAALVTGETPKVLREAIIQDFKTGAIPVAVNCAVLTAGFDYPGLDTVVLARPSLSLRVYMQQVGRVVRPAPGKTAWVVDMVGLVDRFGPLENLELRATGKRGESWEFVSGGRVLTNTYVTDRRP